MIGDRKVSTLDDFFDSMGRVEVRYPAAYANIKNTFSHVSETIQGDLVCVSNSHSISKIFTDAEIGKMDQEIRAREIAEFERACDHEDFLRNSSMSYARQQDIKAGK